MFNSDGRRHTIDTEEDFSVSILESLQTLAQDCDIGIADSDFSLAGSSKPSTVNLLPGQGHSKTLKTKSKKTRNSLAASSSSFTSM
eukprot:Pgem_evm1s18254